MELFENVLYDFPQQGRILATQPLDIPGLEGQRTLSLYLPPHYQEQGSQFFELAYLFEGEHLFDGQRLGLDETPQTWQLHRLLDTRAGLGLPVPIVVGIQNGSGREEELTPWTQGEALLEWVEQELHPYLIDHLPLLEGPEHTLLAGASRAGLLALYACLSRPARFGRALALSPSLWVGQGELADFVSRLDSHSLQLLRLYLDTSVPEASDLVSATAEQGQLMAQTLVDVLRDKGLTPGEQFCWLREAGISDWSTRLGRGLDYFYGACVLNIPAEVQEAA